MATLRLAHRLDHARHVVDMTLEGLGPRRTAEARFAFELADQDEEDLRWYLEDYLQYPVDPAPQIAERVEGRLAELGRALFRMLFHANDETVKLWETVAGWLPDTDVAIASGPEGAAMVPWELLRDPATDAVLALQTNAFVRTHTDGARPPELSAGESGSLRVLLVISRPAGRADVPFRTVASHLARLSRSARDVFQLDVLRPPSFAELAQAVLRAKEAGSPYHIVHFDGHGAYLPAEALTAEEAHGANAELTGWASPAGFSLVSPPRPGSHGFLIFEDPGSSGNRQLVDGPALGRLLARGGVLVLMLNACRSAHAGLANSPEPVTQEIGADQRGRAYGSLAQEVMDAGVGGVVAMRYNVYVVTAAHFIGEVYATLLNGRQLGEAVTRARRHLAASPLRQVVGQARPLQDWVVPVVYEAAPMALLSAEAVERPLIDLSHYTGDTARAQVDPALPPEPDVGFFGRDETLLALDRAFDTGQLVLLHAWAGAGKTSTALEFARWYELTGPAPVVLFTSFAYHLPLARLLDQVGDKFRSALEASSVQWTTLDDPTRRDVTLRILEQVPVLWVWDNVESVAGFPAGVTSAWTASEQAELAAFLRDVTHRTRCKVLLTSRRDEGPWLGNLPMRVRLPPMLMVERLELARAVAFRQVGGEQLFQEVEDWRPLLEFTQGNPLTVTILVRQALRDHRTARDQVEAFVGELRAGAARVTDDGAAQGRQASLAASLDYGFGEAFSTSERIQLALLALFQGFADVDVLCLMGSEIVGEPVQAVAGLTRETGINLLDQAVEVGLLTGYGAGYYAVHPAVPLHLMNLFEKHYGPSGSHPAVRIVRAWTAAISELGSTYHRRHQDGHADVIEVLTAEEPNLLRARQLAIEHGWYDLAIGAMQGLSVLYRQTGRNTEWRRLVSEITPELADPATGEPLPGRERQWAILNEYRVRIALDDRDWEVAGKLLRASIRWQQQWAADILLAPPESLDENQRNQIRSLAALITDLGHVLREQLLPGCVQAYIEASRLFQRIGARREDGIVAFNLGHAYKNIPGLRDLDKAEYWYRRDLELQEDYDTLRQAASTAQLGSIAYDRFRSAWDGGPIASQLREYLDNAVTSYLQALELLPAHAANELAVIHHALGDIFRSAGEAGRALGHYQKAIQLRELNDDRYGTGQARYDAAITLARGNRRDDALLYVRAALRDYESVGPGAARQADRARELIVRLEQEP